jgi:PAS domain S-box-containing protein
MAAPEMARVRAWADMKDFLFSLADMPVPMVFAAHRIIRDCNEPFAHLFGYERDEVIGHSFRQLYQDVGDFVRVGELWRAHLATGVIYFDERVMRRKDGSKLWCRVHGRSNTVEDPLAEAIYCFEPMQRGIAPSEHVVTGRQRQILTLVAQGLTNDLIGAELGLSRRTVEAHRARLMRTVGVRNSAELMAWFNERENS